MPNFSTALKNEVTRVARKEVRAEQVALKKASSQYRTDIAALKRRVQALEKLVKAKLRPGDKQPALQADGAPAVQRFSPNGFAAQRKRLGLSASQFGQLLGVSVQSVYKWEDGKSRPRASNFPAIAAVRKLSKKSAAETLARM